jgi:hypothetical protein
VPTPNNEVIAWHQMLDSVWNLITTNGWYLAQGTTKSANSDWPCTDNNGQADASCPNNGQPLNVLLPTSPAEITYWPNVVFGWNDARLGNPNITSAGTWEWVVITASQLGGSQIDWQTNGTAKTSTCSGGSSGTSTVAGLVANDTLTANQSQYSAIFSTGLLVVPHGKVKWFETQYENVSAFTGNVPCSPVWQGSPFLGTQ